MRSASGEVTEQPPKMNRFHDISSHLLKAQDAIELDHRNCRFCGEFGSREFRGRDRKGYRRKNWSVHFVVGTSRGSPDAHHPSTPSIKMPMSLELSRRRMLAAVVARNPSWQYTRLGFDGSMRCLLDSRSSNGTEIAPGRCPFNHSARLRTSTSCIEDSRCKVSHISEQCAVEILARSMFCSRHRNSSASE